MRDEDRSPIPFLHLKSVTVHALLQMRLSHLHHTAVLAGIMGLHLMEDMAPWNVVVQGSRVAYIDHDTMDNDLDRSATELYRALSALMNLKKTVVDLGACGGKAGGNQYGFPFLADCGGGRVRSKCTRPEAPVACGDGSCAPHYWECLQRKWKAARRERTKRTIALGAGQLAGVLRSDP